MFIRLCRLRGWGLESFETTSPKFERAEEGFYERMDFTVNANGLARLPLLKKIEGDGMKSPRHVDYLV